MIEVCEQMQQLRKLLDEKKIAWKDDSYESGIVMICRTHFEYKGIEWSAVNGFGTYGGYGGANYPATEKEQNLGLIELYDGINEPKGWLTAENVMKEIEK